MAAFPPPTAFRVAQIVGISGAAWLPGNIASVSLITVPSLRSSNSKYGVPVTTLAKQWRNIYNTGKSQNPPIALATAFAFLYLAWSAKPIGLKDRALLYTSAAVFTIAIVPFTILIMQPTVDKLGQKAEGSAASVSLTRSNEDEIDKLLVKWGNLNQARGLFRLLATVIGLMAAL